MELDVSNFVEALNYVEKHTGRAVEESLNRAGLHAIIGSGSGPGAMQLTPKAARDKIKAIPDRALIGFVIRRAKRNGKWPLTTKEISQQVRSERRRRLAAVGYTAYAGWNNAAKAMGGRGIRKGVNKNFPKSKAAKGYGKKASKSTLEAVIANTAPMAEKIGLPALQKGLDNAAKDLVEYAEKKIQKALDRVK